MSDKFNSQPRSFVFYDHYIVYMAFFFLGFNKLVFYLPLFFIYIFLKSPNLIRIRINKSFLLLFLLTFMSIVPVFTIGFEGLLIDNPLRVFIVLLFSFILAGFILQYQSQNVRLFAIYAYIFGIGVEALLISGYSFVTDPLKYGYGKLIEPFSNSEINSPGTSNMLSIFMVLLMYAFVSAKHIYGKFFFLFMMGVTIAAAIFLGGRTFFVIVFITISFLAATRFSVLNFTKFTAGLIFIGLVISYMILNNEYILVYSEFTFSRFDNGLESSRFALYSHGLSQTLNFPLGGFVVDKSIDSTNWFHNVFLDNARLAGWTPVIFLLLTMFYISLSIFKRKDAYFTFGFLIFAISVLIMQQDVVIEGNPRSLVLMYFAGIILMVKKRKIPNEVN